MQDYNIWRIFTATILHFKVESYDAFRFNFKGRNLSVAAYEKAKTRFGISKVKRLIHNEDDARRYAFANVALADTTWIGAMTSDPYMKYLKLIQNFSYVFKRELSHIDIPLDQYLLSENHEYPPIIHDTMNNRCKFEISVVFEALTDFVSHADNEIKDTLLWPSLKYQIIKAKPFIEKDIDLVKAKKIVLNHFSSLQSSPTMV